jgi:diguanylate cyclase
MNDYFAGVKFWMPLALGVVATAGYVFGTLRRRQNNGDSGVLLQLKKDLFRAQVAVSELEKVMKTVHRGTAKHYTRLKKFRKRINQIGAQEKDAPWDDLCREIEGILEPTLELVSEISSAQDRIRYQVNHLMTFSDVRTDPLTRLGNRRALEHMLNAQYGVFKRYGTPFSLAIIDVDHFKTLNDEHGHQYGDQVLCDLAELLLKALRTVDILARYGGDELILVMPHTDLAGAEILCERLRVEIERRMPFTVSIGVASACNADTPERVFKRADAALYGAKNSGRNAVRCDHGEASHTALPLAPAGCESHLDASTTTWPTESQDTPT